MTAKENTLIYYTSPYHSYCFGKIGYKQYHEVLKKIAQAMREKKLCIVENAHGKTVEIAFTQFRVNENILYAQGYLLTKNKTTNLKISLNLPAHEIKDIVISTKKHNYKKPIFQQKKNLNEAYKKSFFSDFRFTI